MEFGKKMLSKSEIKTKNPQQIKILFWSVFASSKGCRNRVKIVLKLRDGPHNTNQLSDELGLDYNVVKRHLLILKMHNLILTIGNMYAAPYFLSPILESNEKIFDEMVTKSKNCK